MPFEPRRKTTKEPTDKHELSDIRVDEVSIVDAPANMRKFLLLKRDDSDPGAAFALDGSIPLYLAGVNTYPPSTTVGDIMEDSGRAAEINKRFGEMSAEEQEQVISIIEMKNWILEGALLNKSDRAQAEQILADYEDPIKDAARTIRILKRVIEDMSPEERRKFDADPGSFELYYPKPVEKRLPDTRTIKYVATNPKPAPASPINVTVVMPAQTAKKTVQFTRDAEGHITGAELAQQGD